MKENTQPVQEAPIESAPEVETPSDVPVEEPIAVPQETIEAPVEQPKPKSKKAAAVCESCGGTGLKSVIEVCPICNADGEGSRVA